VHHCWNLLLLLHCSHHVHTWHCFFHAMLPWSFQATLWQFSSWFFVTNNWSNNMKTAQQENQTRPLLLIKSGNIKFHYHS
jgi:hypothetical protein